MPGAKQGQEPRLGIEPSSCSKNTAASCRLVDASGSGSMARRLGGGIVFLGFVFLGVVFSVVFAMVFAMVFIVVFTVFTIVLVVVGLAGQRSMGPVVSTRFLALFRTGF